MCTGIKLIAKDGSFVHGRTLEFAVQLNPSITVIPRGYQFTGTTPQGPGKIYESKYASVGATAFDNPSILDGLNEKGLAVGTFYFPDYAEYKEINSENKSQAVSPVEFPNWILSQFANVKEVKEGLSSIIIAPLISKEWGPNPPPFHYIVYDKSGECLVIEPLKGKFVTYDNKLGVFTNSPTFDWHLTNLRNYIHLSTFNAKPEQILGMTFKPVGQGSGMVGLPGDFTPPSRFLRAAVFSISATPSETASEGVFQAFHILNQFDIPVGVAKEQNGGVIQSDYTQVTCVRDPQTLKYYFKTYDNQNVQMVDLKKFDLNAKEIKKIKPEGKQTVTDISEQLK